MTEAVPTQLGSEPEHLYFDGRGRRVELAGERRVHVSQRTALRNQIPDTRTDAIEAEVQAALQIEENAFAAQFADDDLIAESEAIINGWSVHVVAAGSVYCNDSTAYSFAPPVFFNNDSRSPRP